MNNNTIPENLINKVRKLLAVGSSSSPHEAELALEKAKALAVQFDLDLSSIEVFENKKSDAPIIKDEAGISLGRRMSVCQKFVSWILQNHFKVRIVYTGSRFYGQSITLVGRAIDIEMAKFVNSFLNEEFMRNWHNYRANNPFVQTKDRGSYLHGLYMGLNQKLENAATQAVKEGVYHVANERGAEEASKVEQCYALTVRNYKKELKDKLEEFYPRLGKKQISVNYNSSSNVHSDGISAGRKINISRPLGNRNSACLT